MLASLVRPLRDDIAATARIGPAGGVPDRLPVRITDVHVGVSYEPLRRLWPLLGDDYALELVHDRVWPDEPEDENELEDELEDDDEDEDEPYERHFLAVSSACWMSSATTRRRNAWASGRWRCWPRPHAWMRRGRRSRATTRQRPDVRRVIARHASSSIRSGRYIDSGGDPAIVPIQPPPAENATVETPSVSEIWQESRAQREAVRVVKAMGPGTDRAELRLALERELAARGLRENPRWIEQTLDHLHDSRAEQARLLAKGVWTAGDLAPTAMATAWLALGDGMRELLLVSLGEERVGTVSPAVAPAYRPDMDGAAERDELPYVPARLTPRSGTYLFEIQLPG